MKRAGEQQFNELHNLVTTELIDRIRSGEATTADLKAAADWLYKNDITGVAFDTSPLSQLADIMPTVDFDTVQKSVIKIMAPRKLPRKNSKKVQDFTEITLSPEQRKTPNRKRNKKPKKPSNNTGWNLRKPRRKAGADGKGGKDFSHTKSGRLVRENPSTNRARNRGKK